MIETVDETVELAEYDEVRVAELVAEREVVGLAELVRDLVFVAIDRLHVADTDRVRVAD